MLVLKALSGLQECPDKRGKQECQARVSSKSVQKECKECPERVSSRSVLSKQKCLTGVSCQVCQECPAGVSSKSVK